MDRNITGQSWFKPWREWADRNLVTPESFEDQETFVQRMQHPLDEGIPTDISFPLSHTGQIGEIISSGKGYFYARSGSAAHDTLNQKIAESEAGYANWQGCVDACAFPSGMSAIYSVVKALVLNIPFENRGCMRFLRGENVYVHTASVLSDCLLEYHLERALTTDTTNPAAVRSTLDEFADDIIALFFETVSNPLIRVTNAREISKIAHDHNIPVIVDNTFLSPYLQQGFRLGADIVVHSATKYIGGEGLAGVVCGPSRVIKQLKYIQNITGPVINPIDALNLAEGYDGLAGRMDEHAQNAATLAEYLSKSEYVEKVIYPDLGNLSRDGSAGGVLSFIIAGNTPEEKIGREERLMNHIANHPGPIEYKVSLGEKAYLIMGETTYGCHTKFEPGLIRLAAGRRYNADKVIPHLENAFKAALQ